MWELCEREDGDPNPDSEAANVSRLRGQWEIDKGRREESFHNRGPTRVPSGWGERWKGVEFRVMARTWSLVWSPDSLLILSLSKSLKLLGPQFPHP